MESPEHRERAARDYFHTQAPEETIEHLERVASERVFEDEFDIWDVHTDQGRWWVITNPTNLYPQCDFKSMDVALSFHIGLTRRVLARFTPPAPDREVMRFPKTWRRVERADEALHTADEAEDFQAVGMRCREALLEFVRELPLDRLVDDGTERPALADFKGWADIVARRLEDRDRPHRYLKSVAKEAWDFVAWLTHAQDATREDARLAVSAVLRVMTTFVTVLIRWERGEPERCPECGSYRLDSDLRWSETEEDVLNELILCEACGWERVEQGDDPTPQQIQEYLERPAPIPEGECTPSSEVSTFMTVDEYLRRNR